MAEALNSLTIPAIIFRKEAHHHPPSSPLTPEESPRDR